MGFWSSIFSVQRRHFSPQIEYVGNVPTDLQFASGGVPNLSVAELWDTQPHLRTVVSFVARNIAHLGLHVFERVGETDRRRDRDSVAPVALAHVDGVMTTYDLIYALVGDLLLFDRAYWWVAPSSDTPSGVMIRRLPPTWVKADMAGNPFAPAKFHVRIGDREVTLGTDRVLAFTGYSPQSAWSGSPTIQSLRQTLNEQVESAKYRGQVWKRGGRVSAVLQRPAGASEWSAEARERFREDWYAKYTGSGSQAGGTPILEDGMTLNRIDFNAQEQQYVEAAKLSLTTVAAAFHVNPTMVGLLDNANYSNVREFRKMLYGDTLGPTITQIEQRLNSFLLPMLGSPAGRYVEFNIAEKLQGNFEEQAAAMQTSTGAPWMTRNEARARVNLPALPGGDDLVVPLNVLAGGQASPSDSGSQNRNSGSVQVKAPAPDDLVDEHVQELGKFFARQERVVRSRMGAKAADWWDAARWDSELAQALYVLGLSGSRRVAEAAMIELGFDPSEYDFGRTRAFLLESARRSAESINQATYDRVEAASGDADAVDEAFGLNESRAGALGVSLAGFVAGFATVEVAQQRSPDSTKTWVAGRNPRSSHAAMDGETVPIGQDFSNGLKWPGAFGDPDEVAGCNCSVTISIS